MHTSNSNEQVVQGVTIYRVAAVALIAVFGIGAILLPSELVAFLGALFVGIGGLLGAGVRDRHQQDSKALAQRDREQEASKTAIQRQQNEVTQSGLPFGSRTAKIVLSAKKIIAGLWQNSGKTPQKETVQPAPASSSAEKTKPADADAALRALVSKRESEAKLEKTPGSAEREALLNRVEDASISLIAVGGLLVAAACVQPALRLFP